MTPDEFAMFAARQDLVVMFDTIHALLTRVDALEAEVRRLRDGGLVEDCHHYTGKESWRKPTKEQG